MTDEDIEKILSYDTITNLYVIYFVKKIYIIVLIIPN